MSETETASLWQMVEYFACPAVASAMLFAWMLKKNAVLISYCQ